MHRHRLSQQRLLGFGSRGSVIVNVLFVHMIHGVGFIDSAQSLIQQH
ncbi:MAG: hypothetical protein ABJF01_14765 [bacterium]